MAEWWQGTFEERMARRLARREAQGLVIEDRGTWDRHGEKYVALRLKLARQQPVRFNYERWLHRKAGEQMEEDRCAKSRLHEIWNAIGIEILNEKHLASLPYHQRIKKAPRIRGCRAAAKRAGFAE